MREAREVQDPSRFRSVLPQRGSRSSRSVTGQNRRLATGRDKSGLPLTADVVTITSAGAKKAKIQSGGCMAHWTASVVAIWLVAFPTVASAQVNCEGIPKGPTRTDCYLGLSQLYRAQSDLAAARARAQSDAAWYRAITGTDPPKHKPHRQR